MWLLRNEVEPGEPWAESLGRAMCVAQNFEKNAKHVLMWLELDRAFERGDYTSLKDAQSFIESLLSLMLGNAVRRFAGLGNIDESHIAVLSAAKDARNYFAHDGGRIALLSTRPKAFAKEVTQFRKYALALAHGDNLVSGWSYLIEDKEHYYLPSISQTYVAQIVAWIFEPTGLTEDAG